MASNDLQVIIKAKELAKHTFKLTSNCNKFPKKYRFSLVDRMQIKAMNIYESLMEANRTDLKKFHKKYGAWKKHALHGNCIKLCHSMDLYVEELFKNIQVETPA